MAATNSLSAKLAQDYPDFSFASGDSFRWSPSENTVFVGSLSSNRDHATLLHELGHAIAGHADFTQDIDLLKMEREAWSVAKSLSHTYKVAIDDDMVEEALDSYRDWLHARSTCPNCSQIGLQIGEDVYRCLICHIEWRVNDARRCGLKRYVL